ncbi:MAG: outer membrane protein transport protein [Myxococcales bacterium]|nr:outer membrane protein transport protein [Myxococcales bacterium]
MRLVPALLATALVTAAAADARAAGFYLTDVGTRGMARGGAFVAAPDSLLAMHYNPAGLSFLRGLHVEADLTLVGMDVSFQRKCPCVNATAAAMEGFDPVALDAELEARYADNPVDTNTLLPIPFLGVGYGLPWLDTTVALAVWGPNSGRHRYGELPPALRPDFIDAANAMPNRYSGIHMKTIEANLGLGVGFRPFKDVPVLRGLRIGGVLMGFQSGNDQRVHLWVNSALLSPDGPEDPGLDAPIQFNFKESFAINWQVGASYEIIPNLNFGFSFRGKRHVKTSGTIDVELPAKVLGENIADPSDDLVTVQGRNVDVELSTAPILRTGLEYQWPGLFRAEVAWVWEGWSAHDRVVITPKDINFVILGTPQELGEIVAERHWKDTWSLRVGGELNMFEPYLGLRAGYYYEPTAVPPERMDPSRVDLDKHGVSLGASTTWYGVTLEVAFQYVAMRGAEVRDSQQVQIAPLVGGLPEYVTTVGNGDYNGQYFIGSAGLSFALDPLLKSDQ